MNRFLVIGLAGLLGVFLIVKFRIGMVRYFDPDEYQYLHWAFHFFRGDMPYKDFMLYTPPVFYALYSQVFRFFGGSAVLIGGRILSFVVFTMLCGLSALLFWVRRRSWLFIVVPLVLVAMPLPSDKFVEIRPDTLAMVFVIAGLILQILWFRTRKRSDAFWSGLFYAISFLTLQKSALSISVALLIAFLFGLAELIKLQKKNLRSILSLGILWFGMGLALPCATFLGWAYGTGSFNLVMYSIFKLPVEVYDMSKMFYQVDPWFYLKNNYIYFRQEGNSFGYITNYLLWGVGLVGVFGGVLSILRKRRTFALRLETIILPTLLAVQIVNYFYLIPYRYTQYMIPSAVFLSVGVGEVVYFLWVLSHKIKFGGVIFAIFILLFGGGLMYAYVEVNTLKLVQSNVESLSLLNHLYTAIPKNEYVLDLQGPMFFYPDPYYVCCMAYGSFTPFLSRPLPSLTAALESTRTKYIYSGDMGVPTLPYPDREYVLSRYDPWLNGLLYVAKGLTLTFN